MTLKIHPEMSKGLALPVSSPPAPSSGGAPTPLLSSAHGARHERKGGARGGTSGPGLAAAQAQQLADAGGTRARVEQEQGRRKLRAGRERQGPNGTRKREPRRSSSGGTGVHARGACDAEQGGLGRQRACQICGGVRRRGGLGGGAGRAACGQGQGARAASSCVPGGRRADAWGCLVSEREEGGRGGDVAKKYSDMRDPHVPHQQNHQQNNFDLAKGGNLAGIESLGM